MDNKKTMEISGTLLYPVTVGMAAFISEESGMRRTSTVLNVQKLSQAEIQFETRNTFYHLHLTQNGVMA